MIRNKSLKIILLGAPGAGKGTISSYLINEFYLQHISTGSLFRSEVDQSGPYASQIKELMINGQLIPDDITNKLACDFILKTVNNNQGFILDGYPRTISQAEFLLDVCDIDYVFYLKIDLELLSKRIIGRRVCFQCGSNYNIYFLPPKQESICDKCHAPLVQRKDDNLETLTSRFNEYQKKTAPLIEFYQKMGKLIEIDASADIKDVYQQIKKHLQ